jgi:hypothetical protein
MKMAPDQHARRRVAGCVVRTDVAGANISPPDYIPAGFRDNPEM